MFHQAVGHQLRPVSSERVCFYDVHAGFDVIEMNLADQLRIGKIQFVEAAADEYSFAVEHRTHRAITHQDALFQRRQEVRHKQKV